MISVNGQVALFGVLERNTNTDGYDGKFSPLEDRGTGQWCERMNELWQTSLVSVHCKQSS